MLLLCRGDKDCGTTPVIQECLRSWLCHQEGSLLIQSSSERSQILDWRCHMGFGPRCIWSKVCIFPLTLYIVTLHWSLQCRIQGKELLYSAELQWKCNPCATIKERSYKRVLPARYIFHVWYLSPGVSRCGNSRSSSEPCTAAQAAPGNFLEGKRR